MSDCGCAGSQQTPPGTPSGVNSLVGATSSFGGTATVPRGTCGPARCPQPPESQAEERQPHCEPWVELLRGNVIGRLILTVGSCFYTLKSKCSGYIFFDADSEEVTVVNPPFVSSRPKETTYGFLGKVVPTVTTVCIDGQDECTQEIRNELAAQVMGEAGCGELVVANFPICGELPPTEAADADKQVRFDYMAALDQEKAGCSPEIRMLGFRMAKRGTGRSAVDCKEWIAFRTFKMRGSQWQMIPAGNPLEASGYVPVLVPVEGGTSEDPCFELRMSSQKLGGGLPTVADNCDTVEYRDKGLATEGWKAVPKGITFHPTVRKSLVATGGISGGTITVTLDDFPEDVCGPIWLEVEITLVTQAGPSGAATTLTCRLNGYILSGTGSLNDTISNQAKAPITNKTINFFFTKGGSGACSATIVKLGYHY